MPERLQLRSRTGFGLAGFLALTLASLPSAAQQADPPIRDIDKERVAPETGPSREPDISLVRSTPSAPPRDAQSVRFVLREVLIEGEPTVFRTEDLAAAFRDLIGSEVSLATLFERAQTLEDAYRAAGYITSRVIVPAQRIEGGIFRIRIVEGFIDAVVVGNGIDDKPFGPSDAAIMGFGVSVKSDRPVRQKTLERALLLTNDLPGVSAQGVLRPAARSGAAGGSDLHVIASRDPWDAYVVIDNRGSEFTGPWAAFAGFALNSFTRFAERLEGVIYTTLDFEEQIVGQINYSQLVGPGGLRAGLSYSNARTRPGEELDPLEFESDTNYGRLFVEYPFIRSVQASLWVALSAEFTNSETTALGVVTADDNVRTVAIEARGRRQDNWRGVTAGEIALVQGLDVLGATQDDDPFKTRADGTAQYTKIAGNLERIQGIPGLPIQVFGRLGGQWVTDPLLSVDEFALGGVRFGRGYEPSELTGDKAFAATLEIQGDLAPQVKTLGSVFAKVDVVQPYVFYDFGAVWDEDTGASDDARTLSSAGFGIHTRAFERFGLDLELAKPLTRPSRRDNDKDWQPYVRVFATF